jgi:hypothetical protein
MIILTLILSALSVTLFCRLLFALGVHALPFFAGMTAGLAETAARDGAQRPNCRRFSSLARSAAIASLVAKISMALAQPSLLIRYSQRI